MEKDTLSPEEQQTIEKMSIFESDLNEKNKAENKELQQLKYYDNFKVSGIKDIDFSNVFITREKDKDGKVSIHMYCGDISNEILSVDGDENLTIKPELKDFLGDIDIEELIKENEKEPGKLKGLSEKMPERSKEKEDAVKDEKEENEEEQKEQDEEEVQKDDFELTEYKKVEDPLLEKMVKQDNENFQEMGIAYDNKNGAFVLMIKQDGELKKAEGFEEAVPTMKTLYSVNGDGEQIEKRIPYALMETNTENRELSITLDEYGYINTGIVKRMPTGERVEKQAQNQEGKGEVTKEENVDQRNSNEATNEYEIIKYEAEKDKVSVEEFQSYLDKVEGDNLMEKIEQVHEIIEEQYRPNTRNR